MFETKKKREARFKRINEIVYGFCDKDYKFNYEDVSELSKLGFEHLDFAVSIMAGILQNKEKLIEKLQDELYGKLEHNYENKEQN